MPGSSHGWIMSGLPQVATAEISVISADSVNIIESKSLKTLPGLVCDELDSSLPLTWQRS